MKSLFLATAAAAAFVAAPALAQDGIGSIGVVYSNSDLDVAGLEAEAENATIDAAVAIPVTADWTVTLDGGFAHSFDDFADSNTNISGRVHATTLVGGVRVGGFAGASEVYGEQLWSVGAEAQTYLDKVTLTGSVAYETLDGVEADIWTVAGDASYFINPNFRINGGAGWTTVDAGGLDVDGWQANVGGEYRIPGTGMGVVAGFTHAELEDVDVSMDTISVGLRFSFGGNLQSRERAGADLGRTAAGVGGMAGALL
ncbi:MAG TPA: hypothetical protein VFF66_01140 [Brevundimonas sp.]|nr:hypothetical protein [Brevundimonas sp.]